MEMARLPKQRWTMPSNGGVMAHASRTGADTMTMTCGFIGLGQMGAPMARNLARHVRLIVHARNPEQARPALDEGAMLAADATAFAKAEAVFLCLPNGDVVSEVLFGSFGLAAALSKGAVVVDTSTIEYAKTLSIHERLAAAGIGYIDAPISGMQAGLKRAR